MTRPLPPDKRNPLALDTAPECFPPNDHSAIERAQRAVPEMLNDWVAEGGRREPISAAELVRRLTGRGHTLPAAQHAIHRFFKDGTLPVTLRRHSRPMSSGGFAYPGQTLPSPMPGGQ